jgi:hypothetical protein
MTFFFVHGQKFPVLSTDIKKVHGHMNLICILTMFHVHRNFSFTRTRKFVLLLCRSLILLKFIQKLLYVHINALLLDNVYGHMIMSMDIVDKNRRKKLSMDMSTGLTRPEFFLMTHSLFLFFHFVTIIIAAVRRSISCRTRRRCATSSSVISSKSKR